MAVKTAKVTGRRQLHFETYQDVLDDVHRLAGGPCRQLGNWSLSEVCQHLTKTMHTSIDGAPGKFPWYLRMIGPLLKKRFLTRPMPAGFMAPPSARTLMPGDEETSVAVADLEKASARMHETSQRKPHPVLGKMSREDWDQLHMRHGELHLSFLVPQ